MINKKYTLVNIEWNKSYNKWTTTK